MLFQQRALNAVMAGAFVAILAIFASSFAILTFEAGGNGTIKTADEAVWWAICTVTTVGYGDYYPVTWEGRLVAFFLMITGAATFGALAGLLASWFIGTEDAAENSELQQVREELAAVRLLLEERFRAEPQVRVFPHSVEDCPEESTTDGCPESIDSKAA
jgi:voltage-gated potassium channel